MTARYKQSGTPSGGWIDTRDGTSISLGSSGDPEVREWLKANTADPVDPPPIVYSKDQAISGRVRTTDAAATELVRFPLALQTGYAFIATIIGVDSGLGNAKVQRSSSAFKRLNAGALTVGAIVVIANHQDAGASTWAVNATPSGNDIVVTVTGVAGRTIDWSISGVVVSFTPAGA